MVTNLICKKATVFLQIKLNTLYEAFEVKKNSQNCLEMHFANKKSIKIEIIPMNIMTVSEKRNPDQ